MRDQISALNAAESLASISAQAPWDRRAAEAAQVSEARRQAQEQVRAAEQDRDQAVATARQEAEDRARATAQEVTRAQEDAARIAEAAMAQVRALEQSRTGLQSRAETSERDLEAARMRISSLADALARAEERAESHAEMPAPEIGRDALVTELAEGIREAARAGDRWRPDYDDLMARTGRQRRWCEYVVRDARSAVLGSGPESPQSASAHAESGAGQLAHANGSGP